LLVTDGSVLNRLAVGTAKHVLVATTGATNGVSWTQIDADGIATGAVTSDKILNGTIMDTDINASATIALSKLATTGTVTATTFVGALTGTASNASKIDNHTVSVGNTQPTSPALNDIWFETA
jgi:hypothetical protein